MLQVESSLNESAMREGSVKTRLGTSSSSLFQESATVTLCKYVIGT
nr:hypothetical protein Iba_chr04cCG3970 [Ipomoea batatas]